MASSDVDHVETEEQEVETLPDDCVLLAGGGPVGLLTATVLAFHGIKSVLLERNNTTTKWPKMDLTNARSMEFLRQLGLSEQLRQRGVSSNIPYTVLISSGLSQEKAITAWLHPSVDEYRASIAEKNDGTMPLEPWQRVSQEIFEAWLKELSDDNPLIDGRWNWKVESVEETETGVKTVATNLETGKSKTFLSGYVVGCDGASSRVRRSIGIPLDGGEVPAFFLLTHFKSKDLARIYKQGRFWHLFMAGESGFSGATISQDEVDTFTTHVMLPLDADETKIDSYESVYSLLGGMYEPYEIKIDEILVRSTYRPSIAVARHYATPSLKVLLAGDAAHQNIPTGGYGMNTGLGDAYDLGWKLASVIKGFGGKGLLASYEQERRPVAQMNVERSGVHMAVHAALPSFIGENAKEIDSDSEKSVAIRKAIHEHYQAHKGENTDLGIEMDYRYKSAIVTPEPSGTEPEWLPSAYTPNTWPGSRAPHVFLKDGSAMFDHYGKDFTLAEFSESESADVGSKLLVQAAEILGMPLKHIVLQNEEHARGIWEKRLVLIRPDGHVSWREDSVRFRSEAFKIVEMALGLHYDENVLKTEDVDLEKKPFTMTTEMYTQDADYKLDKMGEFQQ